MTSNPETISSAATATPNGSLEKISFREKFFYGGGDLASNLVLVLTATFVSFFYTDALGLNAGIIGAIMMVSRLFDGITDILMGYVMDKTKSKHGKARPWMLWLAAPIGVATVLVFLVPNIGDVGKYIYVALTYNLVTTVLYTAINIPYGALTARMSRDQHQRSVINIFRMFMAQVGSLAINALTLPFVQAMGGAQGSANPRGWIIVSCIYGAVAALLFFLCYFNTKERVDIPMEKMSFGHGLKLCFRNDQWVLLVMVWVVMALGMAMGMSMGTYYMKYFLGNEAYVGYLSAIQTAVGLICMAVMMPLLKKFGKRNVALVGAIVSLAGQLLMLVNPYFFGWLAVCAVIKGIGLASGMGTMFAMVADTIEYGHWKTGTRVEGMLYSTTTFGAKVGMGLGMAIAMALLEGAGYYGLAAVQTPAAMNMIRMLYLYVPIPFLVVIPILYWFYKLDKIYPEVMEDLTNGRTKDSQ